MRTAIIALILLTVVLAACNIAPPSVTPPVQPPLIVPTGGDLKKLSSDSDLREFILKAAATQLSGSYGGFRGGIMTAGGVAMMEKSSADSAGAPSAPPSAQATDYSQTNVQVQGVDEADIVKTDGKYIYALSGNTVSIIDAYPADESKIVSELTFKSSPRNIFINGDKLVVFVDGGEEIMRIWEGDFVPRPYYTTTAKVLVYDVSDKTQPRKVLNYSVEGNYYESRMIGNNVYFIVNSYVNYERPILPLITGSKMLSPEAFYFDIPDYSYSFYTVASFDVTKGPDSLNAKSFMLGQSTTLFVSENAIYLAARQTPSWGYYREGNLKRFFDAVLPVLPPETKSRIEALGQGATWTEIATILEDMYNSMDKEAQKAQVEKIETSVQEYEIRIQTELSKTTIHKIKINNGNIAYDGKGSVSGYPLNQFSMDEKDGNLRIATTTEFWTSKEQVQHNNVFVLDSGMNVIGKLENLAKGEKIYSARFMGDRLYMVTFKRIDPLFVIDLSEPRSPKVLGELKIPGYSDYLHPYDENHIIGLGRNTKDTEWGGVTTSGLKLALFDVSDVSNPKQQATYFINGSSTYSEALNDHKAFLFDKKKNILVIPVSELLQEGRYDQWSRTWMPYKTWQGAYVFGLTPEEGFTVKGKITHYQGEDQGDNYYWYGNKAIRRSLYLDDALFTLSNAKIMAHDLNDLTKELADLNLPQAEPYYGYAEGGSTGVIVPEKVAIGRTVE
ncbi:MAG: beta-propeller domain-containing protein [Nanoarchaeota archaeon]